MQEQMKKKPSLPTREVVFERISGIQMSENAHTIILTIVNSAWFDYCIIAKQLTSALGLSRASVENALDELMKIKLIKQQALYGTERNYILNQDYFTANHPVRRSKDELRKMLTVISN